MSRTSFIRSKWLTVALHVFVWGLLFILPLIGSTPQPEHRFPGPRPPNIFVQYIFWVSLFYFNTYVLVPSLFTRKRMPLYIASVAALLAVFMFIESIIRPDTGRHYGMMLFPLLFILAMSITYHIINDHFKNEKTGKEKETENLRSELAFLRSQISPHFIFNVLNNIVSLARKKSAMLEPTLIRLSSLLHYMLYESDDDKISLGREIEYIKDYIDLQRLRFGDRLELETLFNLSEPVNGYQIEPMLLIPFVENAFKHGTEVIENPSIRITLLQEKDELTFFVLNKFIPGQNSSREKHPGIGIGNVKRRLDLLYPNRYTLKLTGTGDSHIVILNLKLT